MRVERRAGQAGFTLLELLVVGVVIGIVASIGLVSIITALDKAKQRATMADMRTISKAIEAYMVDNSVPPTHTGGVSALMPILTPYHSSVVPVQDHWRHDYTYESSTIDSYTLESFGKDGLDGGDITLGSRNDFGLDIVLVNGVFVASPE